MKNSEILTNSNNIFLDMLRQGLFTGIGKDSKQINKKPLIAIANSHTEMTVGHAHLATLANKVKEGIHKAGGECVEFNVPAPCDGMAMGHDGMRFILAQRDLIADTVETYVRSQKFDGVVMLSSCDKINPAMMMAAARLDLPAIYLAGGPGQMDIRNQVNAKASIDHGDYMDDMAMLSTTASCATCGACEIMGTANTFQCIAEAMGICLPGSSNVPAFHSDKLKYAELTGARVVELVEQQINFSKILTQQAIRNAAITSLAIGGSTNALLHLPAIAESADLTLTIDNFAQLSKEIPTLLAMSPNGSHGIIDLWQAGGMPAVIQRLAPYLDMQQYSVAGVKLEQIAEAAVVKNPQVIPKISHAFRQESGIAVLKGNLGGRGAVVKQAGVAANMLTFTGKAICFDDEDAALVAIQQQKITKGHIIVLRYQGPQGAPGMPEMLGVTLALKMSGLAEAALITDGRFSGATSGPCVGHICPEASKGGLIALIEDGDDIAIDIPNRQLELNVDEITLQNRKALWQPVDKYVPKGFLQRYSKYVSDADQGAILQ